MWHPGGDLRLWDTATGTKRTTLTYHRSGVFAVAFSPDGSQLASGSDILEITSLSVGVMHNQHPDSGSTIACGNLPVEFGDSITCIAYAPDGATMAIGCRDGSVVLTPSQAGRTRPVMRLIGLRGGDWAVIHGESRYELHGDPAGQFWWAAGLCRFEPGEADGYGIDRIGQ
jgi:WD40 repeat protein